jgi:hypothetical protein
MVICEPHKDGEFRREVEEINKARGAKREGPFLNHFFGRPIFEPRHELTLKPA